MADSGKGSNRNVRIAEVLLAHVNEVAGLLGQTQQVFVNEAVEERLSRLSGTDAAHIPQTEPEKLVCRALLTMMRDPLNLAEERAADYILGIFDLRKHYGLNSDR